MSKVLIVEDNPMIAEFLEEALLEAGYELCGIASTVAEAIKLGERHSPDLGVFDLSLPGGEYSTEIAAALRRRSRIGVLYATGNPYHPRLIRAEGEGCIIKPYSAISVVSALRVVSSVMSGRTMPTFPSGFRLLDSTAAAKAA